MPVKRIHIFQSTLAQEFGSTVPADESTYHAFPRPDELVAASESELRDLGLGVRTPYVERTTQMTTNGISRMSSCAADRTKNFNCSPASGPK